jgi:hypothetical protein
MGYIPRLPLADFLLLYLQVKRNRLCCLARSIFDGAATTAAELYLKKGTPFAR